MGTAITKVTKQSSPKKHHCSLGYRLPIRLQARVPGYSQRPSVTKDRLWLQVPDLLLKLYHSFPLFPKQALRLFASTPVFIRSLKGQPLKSGIFSFAHAKIPANKTLQAFPVLLCMRKGYARLTNTLPLSVQYSFCHRNRENGRRIQLHPAGTFHFAHSVL